MQREYFLAETLDAAEQAVTALHQQLHIDDRYIHVISHDSNGLDQHHLHPANLIHKSDLVRGIELGLLCGLVASLFAFSIAALGSPFWEMSASLRTVVFGTAILAPLLVGGSAGAWIGLQHENYKIDRFHRSLEQGQHLILVDSDHLEPIKQILADFPVIDEGTASTLILPFEQPTTSKTAPVQTAA